MPDLSKKITAAGLKTAWLHDLAAIAQRVDEHLFILDLPRLKKCVQSDLATMTRPVLRASPAREELQPRMQHCLELLGALAKDRLNDQEVDELTQGRPGERDSLHLLVGLNRTYVRMKRFDQDATPGSCRAAI